MCMISIGIDIAGAHGKRFELAIVRWGSTPNTASHVTWGTLPLGHPNTGYPICPLRILQVHVPVEISRRLLNSPTQLSNSSHEALKYSFLSYAM